MKIMGKSAWYIHTELQFKVNEIAINKGYETYLDKERSTVYFVKRKHARKVALRMGLSLEETVYHATLEFLMAN